MITQDTAIQAAGLATGFLAGIVGHELAHAVASDRLGDKTPRFAGRVTLNPAKHADPLGTIILPGIFTLTVLVGSPFGAFFGWAKPVPTNPWQLRDPRNHRVIVAVAGPLTNLLIVALAGAAFRAASGTSDRAARFLFMIVVVNGFLFVLNILPIPPLDGSKVLARFLSPQAGMKMEELGQYGLLFLLLILLFDPLRNILSGLVEPVVRAATGLG